MLGAHLRRLNESRLGKRLIDTTFWSFLGEGLARGLMLLALVLVARILGPGGYGEVGLIRTTITMVASFGGMGLGLMANRFVAEYRARDATFAGELIGASYSLAALAGLLLGAVTFVAADYISVRLLDAPWLGTSFRLAGLVLFGAAITGGQIGILQGLGAYRTLALGNLLQGVIAVSCLLIGAHLAAVDGVVTGLVVHAFASVAIFHFLIRRELNAHSLTAVWGRFARIKPILGRFMLPLALMSVAVAPFKWISETILARSAGFAELGAFHAAMTVANVLIAIATTVNAPLISLTAGIENRTHHFNVQYANLYGSWYLFLGIAVPLVIFPSIAIWGFGVKFQTQSFHLALLLLILYGGMLLYYQGIMRLVTLNGSMWFGFCTNLCEGAALMIAFFALAVHGVIGLGLAYLISYVVRIAVSVPFLLRGGVVSRQLLFDRYFLFSLAVFSALVAWRIGVLS